MNKAEKFRQLARNALYNKYGNKIDISYHKILCICEKLAEGGGRSTKINVNMVNELENEFIVNEVAALLKGEGLVVKTWWLSSSMFENENTFENMEISW